MLKLCIGDYIRPLSEWNLRKKYQKHCQVWQEWAEFTTQKMIKQQYKYDGDTELNALFVKDEFKEKKLAKSLYPEIKWVFERKIWSMKELFVEGVCKKKVVKEMG